MGEPATPRLRDARLPGWPGGLRRELAAAYLGIGPTKFDEGVERGVFPRPVQLIDSVKVWRLTDLDAVLNGEQDASPATGAGWERA